MDVGLWVVGPRESVFSVPVISVVWFCVEVSFFDRETFVPVSGVL